MSTMKEFQKEEKALYLLNNINEGIMQIDALKQELRQVTCVADVISEEKKTLEVKKKNLEKALDIAQTNLHVLEKELMRLLRDH